MNFMEEALAQIRLDARHGVPPMSLQELRDYCRGGAVAPDEVRAAEREGRELLASGRRCLCHLCEANAHAIGGKERLRQHYAARRHAQLQAQGVSSYEERRRTIEQEINAGAAFQAGPVQITRNGGAP